MDFLKRLKFGLDKVFAGISDPRIHGVYRTVIHPRLEDEDVRRLNRSKDPAGSLPRKTYREYIRTSQYIPNRDGLKLAADIYWPAVDGKIDRSPKPVIWANQRYHRRMRRVLFYEFNMTFYLSQWAEEMIYYGYIVAIIDIRGGGASFGSSDSVLSEDEVRDGYDICEWFAGQPWCDGSIGMFGESYTGSCQLDIAAIKPPHLKAVSPEVPFFDLYSFVYPNGVFRYAFAKGWNFAIESLDKFVPPPPVEGDHARKMLRQARRQHVYNRDLYKLVSSLPYRDSIDPKYGTEGYDAGPVSSLEEVRKTHIPAYFVGGWRDLFTDQTIFAYLNWGGKKKLIMGPWNHRERFSGAAERHKWFGYWLRGEKNSVMKEFPIYYYTMGRGGSAGWKAAKQWPVPEAKPVRFYFGQGETGTVRSLNDGSLTPSHPKKGGRDEYVVDYRCTTGVGSRWHLLDIYLDMRGNDEKGLTFTGEPLEEDVEITGHPLLEIWASTYDDDFDLFAYIEDVSPAGYSDYVTEGTIAASHRKESECPYTTPDQVYHSGLKADAAPMPKGGIELLRFNTLPVSYSFPKGHRIRVTLTGCDKDNYAEKKTTPPQKFIIYRSAQHPSGVVFPVVGKTVK